MHKNLLWQAFLLLVFIAAFVYSAIAGYRLYTYSLLNETTLPSEISWKVTQLSSDQYIVQATYHFYVNKDLFAGATAWKEDFYLNDWAAQRGIEANRQKTWEVWYDSYNPSYSSLQKKFPTKQCITAVFLWMLCLYFLGLGYYVAKYKT